MRAHGNAPAPSQRPLLAGILGAALGSMAAILPLQLFGSLEAASASLGLGHVLAGALFIAVWLVGGAMYGWVFNRAAADPAGGWLFGISFGYLLWMLGPAMSLQAMAAGPVAKGTPGLALLGGFILYGLVLGLVFPFLSRRLEAKISATRAESAETHGGGRRA